MQFIQEILGLLGAKGAGKDTAAKLFIQKYGYRRIAFADALYLEVANAFGVTVEFLNNRDTKETPLPELALAHCQDANFVQVLREMAAEQQALELDAPRSPRWILQMWGTEYRRVSRFGYDAYWLDRVGDVINANPTVNFVITDVRYKNEANFVTQSVPGRFGRLVRVRRPLLEEKEAQERAAKGTAAHRSETEMLGYPVDHEAFNTEGNPAALHQDLNAWYQTPVAA